jgi:hypothetical protein
MVTVPVRAVTVDRERASSGRNDVDSWPRDAVCWHARRGSSGDLQRARLSLRPVLPGNAWAPGYLGCAGASAYAPREIGLRVDEQTDGHRRIRWPSARKSLSATS